MKKKIIAAALITLSLISIGLYAYFNEKIYYDSEDTVGNSAGNTYNGGLFCEIDGTIYFSNHRDDGMLYSMDADCTQIKKLSNDKVASLNADSHYLYFSRLNYAKADYSPNIFNYQNSGLYRMSRKNQSVSMLYDGLNLTACLAGNTLYYQHYDKNKGIELYQVSIDKKEEGLLLSDAILPASVRDGRLYYAGELYDHYLHALNLKTKSDTIISENYCYLPIVTKAYIYFIAPADGYHLCRMSHDGSGVETLAEDFCFTYNISNDERYLYYQIDGGSDNRLVKLDLASGMKTTLIDGNFNKIHVTSNYVFFYNLDGTAVYAYNQKTGVLNLFNPPVLELKK